MRFHFFKVSFQILNLLLLLLHHLDDAGACPARSLNEGESAEPPGTDPYARWCRRGGIVRCPPIPIDGESAHRAIISDAAMRVLYDAAMCRCRRPAPKLLFEVFSQPLRTGRDPRTAGQGGPAGDRHGAGADLRTGFPTLLVRFPTEAVRPPGADLPFDEWTSVFGSEQLTDALLDRLTHHVHILEMNGESYRLAQSKRRSRRSRPDTPVDGTASLTAVIAVSHRAPRSARARVRRPS